MLLWDDGGKISCVSFSLSPLSSPSVTLFSSSWADPGLSPRCSSDTSPWTPGRVEVLSLLSTAALHGTWEYCQNSSFLRSSSFLQNSRDTRKNTYSFAYPIPPILQTAVSQAVKAFSPAKYLTAFAYSPVAKPSSHIFAACMIINRVLSS
jgi:hypothetical protein